MTFHQRLNLAQAPLAGALLLVTAASLGSLSRLGGTADAILKDNYRSVLAVRRMAAALEELDRGALLRAVGRLTAGAGGSARDLFERELAVQTSNITEAGEAAATQRTRAAWEAYLKARAQADAGADPLAAYLGPLQEASRAVRAETTRSPLWAGSSTPWPTTSRGSVEAISASSSAPSRRSRPRSTACPTPCS